MISGKKEFYNSISCIPGCANCCPKDCKYLSKSNFCKVHPDRLGVTPQVAEAEYNRGLGCHSSPHEIFTYGVYCPPIIKKLQEELNITINHFTGSKGVETMVNAKEVIELTREVRGIDPAPNPKGNKIVKRFLKTPFDKC